MHHITLKEEQCPVLLDISQCAIPQLHSEIYHTDDLKACRWGLEMVWNMLQDLPAGHA